MQLYKEFGLTRWAWSQLIQTPENRDKLLFSHEVVCLFNLGLNVNDQSLIFYHDGSIMIRVSLSASLNR